MNIDFNSRTNLVGFERNAIVGCNQVDCNRTNADNQKFDVVNNTNCYCKHYFDNVNFEIIAAELVDDYLRTNRIVKIENFVVTIDYDYCYFDY